jgi:hypothetical protein
VAQRNAFWERRDQLNAVPKVFPLRLLCVLCVLCGEDLGILSYKAIPMRRASRAMNPLGAGTYRSISTDASIHCVRAIK